MIERLRGLFQRVNASKHWPNVRGLLLVLLVFMAVRAFQTRELPSGVAPTINARDLNGALVSLDSYRGKPMVLHFWASWCGVCRAMEHNVASLSNDTPVLTIASLSGATSSVRSYATEHGMRYPIVNDDNGVIAKRFGVSAFPTSFVIDGNGKIRHADVGYTTELGLRARTWLASW